MWLLVTNEPYMDCESLQFCETYCHICPHAPPLNSFFRFDLRIALRQCDHISFHCEASVLRVVTFVQPIPIGYGSGHYRWSPDEMDIPRETEVKACPCLLMNALYHCAIPNMYAPSLIAFAFLLSFGRASEGWFNDVWPDLSRNRSTGRRWHWR